jgi:hypothetical protein
MPQPPNTRQYRRPCSDPTCESELDIRNGSAFCYQHTCKAVLGCRQKAIFNHQCVSHIRCKEPACTGFQIIIGSMPTGYCPQHARCATIQCKKTTSADSSYCADHRCLMNKCKDPRQETTGFCTSHSCRASRCRNSSEVGTDSDYCHTHRCQYKESPCSDAAKSPGNYCLSHRCRHDGCQLVRIVDGAYCPIHTCAKSGCTEHAREEGGFCTERLHACSQKGCPRSRLVDQDVPGDWCLDHQKEEWNYQFEVTFLSQLQGEKSAEFTELLQHHRKQWERELPRLKREWQQQQEEKEKELLEDVDYYKEMAQEQRNYARTVQTQLSQKSQENSELHVIIGEMESVLKDNEEKMKDNDAKMKKNDAKVKENEARLDRRNAALEQAENDLRDKQARITQLIYELETEKAKKEDLMRVVDGLKRELNAQDDRNHGWTHVDPNPRLPGRSGFSGKDDSRGWSRSP